MTPAQERFVGTLLEFHFRDGGAHALDVATEGIDQQILAGTVEALRLGGLGAGLEGVSSQQVDLLPGDTLVMHHHNGHVVAGGAQVVVGQQPIHPGVDMAAVVCSAGSLWAST
jgi:hypothetical protein